MARLDDMFKLRQDAAAFYRNLGLEKQTPNGDEKDFPDLRANFTKGFMHNADTGLVADPAGYQKFFHDVTKLTATPATQAPLVDPMCGLAYDTAGPDGQQFALPAPPKFTSDVEIAEIAENYWMALLRDVSFNDYATSDLAKAAVAHLKTFKTFEDVTLANLFRGPLDGEETGPFLSQFLTVDVPYGSQKTPNQIAFSLPAKDYMMAWDEFITVQNGLTASTDVPLPVTPRAIANGRDMSNYVHIDELFQAYLNACLILISPKNRGGWGALSDEGNPYSGADTSVNPPVARHMNEAGFGTLGEPNFKTMVCEVATRALKQVWNQKWFVHRRLRPEAFGGILEAQRRGKVSNFVSAQHVQQLMPVLTLIEKKTNGTWLLPMAFPEGCPQHPAYGAGHATVAGACITMLKALFHEQSKLSDLGVTPMMVDGSGNVVEYKGADAKDMTVLGELNKLASNIGLARNIAGVHWRTDYTRSVVLGERIALYYLQEYINTYAEDVSFHIHTFNGNDVVIGKHETNHFDNYVLPLAPEAAFAAAT